MIRTLAAVAAITAVALTLSPAQAGSETGTYVAGPFVRCCNQLHEAAGVGIGGYQFVTPRPPTKVILRDENGPGVSFSLCQENEATEGEVPGNCGGEGDDVSVSFCSKDTGHRIKELGFKKKSPITVFVHTTNGSCPQVGTAGTIKIKWRS